MRGAANLLRDDNANAPPGGGGRDRTDDPLLAKQVLSQLSYAPKPGNTKPTTMGQQWASNNGPGRTRTSDPTLIKRVL